MHQAAYEYVEKVVKENPVSGLKVLEIGSYNVNGSPRPLFADAAKYVGVDTRAGPDVDVVMDARDYSGKGFDVVVCMETLEHDRDPAEVLKAAFNALKEGGLLIVTAASTGRMPHSVDGGAWDGVQPYENISARQMKTLLADWAEVDVTFNQAAADVYATARKPHTKVVKTEVLEKKVLTKAK